MKSTKLILLALLAGLSTWGSSARSEDNQTSGGIFSKLAKHEKAEVITRKELDVALTARDVLGRVVVNTRGERLGTVVDCVLKGRDGEFDKLVLSTGGFLGLGLKAKLVLVPHDKIEHKPGTERLVWDISKQDFAVVIGKGRTAGRESRQMAAARHHRAYHSPKGATMAPTRNQRTFDERSADDALAKANTSGDLIERVKAELKADPAIAARVEDLKLTMEEGQLVIQGEVDSAPEKKRILQLAGKATDREIVDKVTVKPAFSSSR
ncbi:MAG: PRC-barrel domain-containing protein [Verrucomicrobia bacterium]|nr:PRC-barrel domain-containing protein [Verrucomicrobiota bacterium]